jgi:hypothetical protein
MFSTITADAAKTHLDDLRAQGARYRRGPRTHRGVRRFRRQGHRQAAG